MGWAPGGEVNAELILGDPSISILEGVVLPWGEPLGVSAQGGASGAGEDFQVRSQCPVEQAGGGSRDVLGFDIVLNTVSADIPIADYVRLLKPAGVVVNVGLPPAPTPSPRAR